MSIANRESAAQCLARARAASRDGQLAKAIALCDKSIRLYDTDDAQSFLAALRLKKERSDAAPKQAPRAPPAPATHGPVRGNYTSEQQSMAIEVVQTTCYYARLGVPTTATEDEIKKAYKRRAFVFHPDKNHAPAADDAFKAVNQAHECLTDADRKAAYDRYGTETPQQESQGPGGGGGRHQGYSEDVLTPEDLIRMFFSNGQHQQTQFRRQRGGAHHHQQHGGAAAALPIWLSQFAQFVPIILLILFSFFSGSSTTSGSSDAPFQLDRSSSFSVPKTTSGRQIPYYVGRDFNRWYGHDSRSVAQIESMVERDYFARLSQLCTDETNLRKDQIAAAQQVVGPGQATRLQSAHAMPTASCDRLEALYAKVA